MNPMKKIFIALTTIAIALFTVITMIACKTTSPATIQAIAAATQIAVKDGTFLYTQAHPETRPQFQTAANTLRQLSTTTTLNFSAALAVLRQLPIKEVQDPVVQIVVSDADIILTYFNVNVPLTDVEHLRPIVVALAQGIEDGLAMTPVRDAASARPCRVIGRNGEVLQR